MTRTISAADELAGLPVGSTIRDHLGVVCELVWLDQSGGIKRWSRCGSLGWRTTVYLPATVLHVPGQPAPTVRVVEIADRITVTRPAAGEVPLCGNVTKTEWAPLVLAPTVKPSAETLGRVAVDAYEGIPYDNDLDLRGIYEVVGTAVLALLPGRTEAEVKAEALREAAAAFEDRAGPSFETVRLRVRAGHIERGEGRG